MILQPNGRLALLPFSRIMREELPPLDWDVESLFDHGSRVVLYGEFGSLKSWILPSVGLHLAAGKPWLGKFPIPKPRRVLYVDEEMGDRRLRRRIHRLARGAGLEAADLPFQAISRAGLQFDKTGAQVLLKALEVTEYDPDVLIVETFRRVLVGSENEQEAVSAFWSNVEPIVRAGKTLFLSHHMRKPYHEGKGSNRNRASGSTDILAGADVTLAVERSASADVVLVETTKSRDVEECPPFAVSLYSEGDLDGPVELRFEGYGPGGIIPPGKLEQAIVLIGAYLAGRPDRAAPTEAIHAHTASQGISTTTSERALNVSRKAGRIMSPTRGMYVLVGAA